MSRRKRPRKPPPTHWRRSEHVSAAIVGPWELVAAFAGDGWACWIRSGRSFLYADPVNAERYASQAVAERAVLAAAAALHEHIAAGLARLAGAREVPHEV